MEPTSSTTGMTDLQMFMLIFVLTWCWLAYEIVQIRRDFKAMIQELVYVKRVLIDARASLDNIAESVKTPEAKAGKKR